MCPNILLDIRDITHMGEGLVHQVLAAMQSAREVRKERDPSKKLGSSATECVVPVLWETHVYPVSNQYCLFVIYAVCLRLLESTAVTENLRLPSVRCDQILYCKDWDHGLAGSVRIVSIVTLHERPHPARQALKHCENVSCQIAPSRTQSNQPLPPNLTVT